MSNGYQQLQKYKGSLYGAVKYSGIEYDYEVADNQVISSPGGLSGIHHHYTKGMYSPAVSYNDIYGGDQPAYPYAEFANLYQVGQSAPYYVEEYAPPTDTMYTPNQSSYKRDNFVPGVELIPPSNAQTPNSTGNLGSTLSNVLQTTPISLIKPARLIPSIRVNPIILFLIFLAMYIALDFWMYAGEGFIVSMFHNGRRLNWKWNLFYAVIFTIIFLCIIYFSGSSLISLEEEHT